jgi:hypothetical protein
MLLLMQSKDTINQNACLFGYFVFKFQGTHNLEADINDTKKRKEN